MSTSPSDKKPGPPAPAGAGMLGLFRRAVEEQQVKAAAAPSVVPGEAMQVRTCDRCGAPRQSAFDADGETLICRFCGERI